MIIEESDFRLTPVSEGSNFWDLELLSTVKPKGKESRQEFKINGYGMTLPSAIKRIANYRMEQKYPAETILTLEQYLKEYKKIVCEVSKICLE